jgi:hypothetical protein
MLVVIVTVGLAALILGEEGVPNFGPKPYSLDKRDNSTVRAGRMDGKVIMPHVMHCDAAPFMLDGVLSTV